MSRNSKDKFIKKHVNFINALIFVLLGIVALNFIIISDQYTGKPSKSAPAAKTKSAFSGSPITPPAIPAITAPEINQTKIIPVPFTSQAPYGNWDKLHDEACEEADVIMANAWLKDINLTKDLAENEIQRLSAWSLQKFNAYDNSAAQTAQMAKEVYGINSRLIYNPTVKDIQNEIDKGNIVLMGMNGKILINMHYTAPGPVYHMLLIKGYDRAGFITNDAGTRYGDGFHFSYENVMSAAHDWRGSAETLASSPAVGIIISKEGN